MYTKQQEKLLIEFAQKSDNLFDLGVISTDSFTGEIGEYMACLYFNLQKCARVNKAVDGICESGERYQIKATVISTENFSFNVKKLQNELFDYLIVVYFDKMYNPIKIIIVPSNKIQNGEVKINKSTISSYKEVNGSKIKIPVKIKTAINEFAIAHNILEKEKIIRSRRIVGDIGEFYACTKLGLDLSENRNEKGIDARHANGLTFEIKTRRVYQSGRRLGETRRLNNLVGKTADYLIVVTLNSSFKCSGMWIVPMQNITNPKSANLKIVNNTFGTLNIVPSEIHWLMTGKSFKSFTIDRTNVTKNTQLNLKKNDSIIKSKPERNVFKSNNDLELDADESNDDTNDFVTPSKDINAVWFIFIILVIFAIIFMIS